MPTHETPRLDAKLLELVYEIKANIAAIRERQDEDHDRLFGNGQPGELAQMRADTKANADWITRADEREKTNRKWTATISTVFGTAFGAIAGGVVKLLWK